MPTPGTRRSARLRARCSEAPLPAVLSAAEQRADREAVRALPQQIDPDAYLSSYMEPSPAAIAALQLELIEDYKRKYEQPESAMEVVDEDDDESDDTQDAADLNVDADTDDGEKAVDDDKDDEEDEDIVESVDVDDDIDCDKGAAQQAAASSGARTSSSTARAKTAAAAVADGKIEQMTERQQVRYLLELSRQEVASRNETEAPAAVQPNPSTLSDSTASASNSSNLVSDSASEGSDSSNEESDSLSEESDSSNDHSEPDMGEDDAADSDNDEETTYTVEKVVDRRVKRSIVQYLIKWADYPDSDNTWEPEGNLRAAGVREMIEEYHSNH